MIDRHFNDWLRAQHPSSGFDKDVLPFPPTTPKVAVDDTNWSSLRKAVFRATKDRYSYICPLPQSRKSRPLLLYPFSGSEIPDEHADAFEVVIDISQANVNLYAQSCETEVHYELWICGSSKK